MDLDELDRRVAGELVTHPWWRLGQAYFNALESMDFSCASVVRNSDVDPFFDDNRIEDLREFLSTWLEDE